MKSWMIFLSLVVCAVAVMPLTSAASVRSAAPITVSVTALHGDGTPFPDLWLVLIANDPAAEPSEWIAKSDAAGLAQFSVELPPSSENVFVKVAGMGAFPLAPVDARQAVREQDSRVIQNYSFPTFLTVPLQDGVAGYHTTLTLYPSVRVTAQMVDEQGQPVAGGAIMQMNGIGMDNDMHGSSNSSPLSIGGIRRGGTAEVAIYGPSSPIPLVVRLEPFQTAEDVDLGPIHIPPFTEGSAPVRLTITGRDQTLTRSVEGPVNAVTLIRSDGQVAYFFAVVDDRVVRIRADDGVVHIDPGTYYIAPGVYGTSRADLLRQLLLNGVDVDTAGVPKFTAVAGQEVELTVDAAAAERAILAAAGQ